MGTQSEQNIQVLVSLVFVDSGENVCSPQAPFWVLGCWFLLSGESGQFRSKLLLFSSVPLYYQIICVFRSLMFLFLCGFRFLKTWFYF